MDGEALVGKVSQLGLGEGDVVMGPRVPFVVIACLADGGVTVLWLDDGLVEGLDAQNYIHVRALLPASASLGSVVRSTDG